MALGASVVKGETSPGNVGFRKPMRDSLVDLGFTVNMVGAVRLGDMVDNDVEAYGGKKITEMHDYARKSVPRTLPNVFVINLGTNNVLQNVDVDLAGEQMGDLINYLLTASNRSVVILSTLLTNTVPDAEPKVLHINEQYRSLMPGFEAQNKSVVLVEMHPSEGVAGVPTIDDIGPDGSHPTVEGYATMARRFIQGIQDARNRGYIQTPVDNGIPDDGEAERAGQSTTSG
ncbi:SGNH hydrolase-type esterase domain-containing protein [Biscogniauxia mediterranea]|nr:SGNH hydrolase-type esterase domain-containing protein [Biscogniauxia mediterranea]